MDRSTGFVQRTRVVVGGGAHSHLPEICQHLGTRRPAILCDAALADSPVLEMVIAQLPEARIVVCPPGEPSPESVARARDSVLGVEADGLLALGGGSTIDTGKLLRGLIASGAPTPTAIPQGQDLEVLPYVAIPTTAGTGAEMGAGAVVLDREADNKVLVKIEELAADYAVGDGWLTVTLPSAPTAFTGADALAQAFLAYIAAGPESISGRLALDAVETIFEWLPRVVEDGADRDARAQMMLGSVTSAIAMFNAPIQFGLEHAIAEPLGAAIHLPHGHLVAAFLADTAQYNLAALAPRYAEIGARLGIDGGTTASTAEQLIERVRGLIREIGIEPLAATAGDQPLGELADRVIATGTLDNSPVPMARDDLIGVLEAAWAGDPLSERAAR
jgi:alcohol dehydrogenase class IV